MSKEYIECEAALNELKEELNIKTPMYTDEQNRCIDLGLRIAIKDIKKLPIANVTSVVRCKNCKHGQSLDTTKPPYKYYKESCIMCTCEDVVGDEPMVYLPDHFCSYGEEKQ